MIKVYSAEWCSSCKVVKQTLMQQGIPYEVVDVDETPEVMDALVREGVRGLPVLDKAGKLYVGMKGMQELLNER